MAWQTFKPEHTSDQIASIAARGIKAPQHLSLTEIRAVCASALTQARPKRSIVDRLLGRG